MTKSDPKSLTKTTLRSSLWPKVTQRSSQKQPWNPCNDQKWPQNPHKNDPEILRMTKSDPEILTKMTLRSWQWPKVTPRSSQKWPWDPHKKHPLEPPYDLGRLTQNDSEILVMTKHDPLHVPDLLARYFHTCVFKKEKCFIFQQGTYAGGKKLKFNSLTHSFISDGAATELLRDDARGSARG